MSEISDLLLEKAASLNARADELDAVSSAASVETNEVSIEEDVTVDSWSQIKQAAVNELVEKTEMDEATAESLVERLGENYAG